MADTKITALTAISTVDPAVDVLPIVDVSDTTMAASGTTKKITSNQILGAGGTATLASATITGDLTVATDRLKVVTGSTAIQTGATTQLQVGTTSWPSTVIGKSGSRSLFGNAGEVIIWNEAAAAIGNYSTLFVSAKTGAGATTMGGLQIRAGIENASNSDGFVSLWTSNSAAGGFVERYKIDSTGVATWSNVGGVAGTAMTLNSTGLGLGGSPLGALDIRGTSSLVYDVSGNLYALANFGTKGTSGGSLLVQTASVNSTYGSGLAIDGTYSSLVSTINIKALGVNSAAYSSQISFSTTSSGSLVERMLIDKSGNVGVGVAPSAWSGLSAKVIEFGSSVSNNSLWGNGVNDVHLVSNSYFNGSSWIYNKSASATRYNQLTGSHAWYSAPSGTAGNAVTWTQAMTLDASGNLIVGNTAASAVGTTGGVVNVPNSGNTYTLIGHTNGSASGSAYLNFFYNASPIGSITQNGTTGVLYNINSDYRLKESVVPLSGGLARVNALKPSIYKWKSDGSAGEGFIAHELAEVVPFAVTGEKDAVNEDGSIKSQGIDMSRIVPILVAAIQELTARVEALEA